METGKNKNQYIDFMEKYVCVWHFQSRDLIFQSLLTSIFVYGFTSYLLRYHLLALDHWNIPSGFSLVG
jgi:hypothetical protein